MKTDRDFESKFDASIQNVAIAILFGLVPVMAVAALVFGKSLLLAVVMTLAIAAGPALLKLTAPRSRLIPIAIGIAAISFSALLIHLGSGMIEMHIHQFISLAVLIGAGSRSCIGCRWGSRGSSLFLLHLLAGKRVQRGELLSNHSPCCVLVATAVPAVYIAGRYRAFIRAQGAVPSRCANRQCNGSADPASGRFFARVG